MPSIFGQDFKNAVAAARGRPPGWGTPGHDNYMLPGTRGMSDPSYVSPLMGGLQQPQGPMGNQPPMGSAPMGPSGSIPPMGPPGMAAQRSMAPPSNKFGSQTGPVNPGGPPAGMAGQGGMAGMFGVDTSQFGPIGGPTWMGSPEDQYNRRIAGGPPVGGSIPTPPKDTTRQQNALRQALMSQQAPPPRNFSIGRR